MAEVQALETISTEVDESQFKVILSTQCIKAQAFLVDKLRKLSERSKEMCNFISSANSKLQFEITQAQQEINSLLISQETIKMANVELKKDLLMTKDKKIEVIERVKNGEKKYEDLWKEGKARYESLPFVQKLLKAKDEAENINKEITKLEDDEKILIEEIEVKKKNCLDLDCKRIIELAEFIVNEMPKSIHLIKEKSGAIHDLMKELKQLDAKANVKKEELTETKETKVSLEIDTGIPIDGDINDSALIMPKLQLGYFDFDILSVNLDQMSNVLDLPIWIKREDSFNKSPEKNKTISISLMEINAKKVNRKVEYTEEYISSFFNKPSVLYDEHKTQNYAKMKLINILEDIKIDTNEAEKIMAKVNPEKLQSVDMISVDGINSNETCEVFKSKDKEPLESGDIEEIDITSSNAENLLLPPTQFLDIAFERQISTEEQEQQEEAFVTERASTSKDTQVFPKDQEQQEEELVPASTSKEILNISQAFKSSQELLGKKKLSFDLPNTLDSNMVSDAEKPAVVDEIDANKTLNSQQDDSAVSDEGFAKIKDMIIKKHNLDLSPQFVYAKNIMAPMNLQKSDDAVVTSKFFQHNENYSKAESNVVETVTIDNEEVMDVDIIANPKETENISANTSKMDENTTIKNDVDDAGPKRQKINEMTLFDKPVGFPMNHGALMISDSLDASISTTGFEDGDVDFPHCIDSSLLLSPKADIPMPVTGENQEVLSQDVPNFLSGLRKTGLSFFGHLSSSEPKSDSNAQNEGGSGFSFNFRGEEKKSRGGLFSMFQ